MFFSHLRETLHVHLRGTPHPRAYNADLRHACSPFASVQLAHRNNRSGQHLVSFAKLLVEHSSAQGHFTNKWYHLFSPLSSSAFTYIGSVSRQSSMGTPFFAGFFAAAALGLAELAEAELAAIARQPNAVPPGKNWKQTNGIKNKNTASRMHVQAIVPCFAKPLKASHTRCIYYHHSCMQPNS